jgi:hypothetical protein
MAENAEKTHCIRGHEFTPENTYIQQGWRQCKTCRLIRQREWKAAHPSYFSDWRKKRAATDPFREMPHEVNSK